MSNYNLYLFISVNVEHDTCKCKNHANLFYVSVKRCKYTKQCKKYDF